MGAPLGNQNATRQRRMVTDMLTKVVAQDPEKLRKACQAVFDKAAEGDLAHFQAMTDRIDGKAIQSFGVSPDEDDPLRRLVATASELVSKAASK